MRIKTTLLFFLTLIIVGVGTFYGGMKYEQRKTLLRRSSNFRNLSPRDRQQFLQKSGFIAGEVISKDEKSLTLKLADGNTKIIFFSESTQISKTIQASVKDIEIGKQIMVSGSENPDGSYIAKIIQVPFFGLKD